MQTILKTEFPGLPLSARGKVRDIYDLGDQLLFVSTDRISAYDCVLPNGIPGKGAVLNLLSAHWMAESAAWLPNHIVTTTVDDYPAALAAHRDALRHRSMIVRKADMVPVECVVRGYLAGSGWREYSDSGRLAGRPMPEGLQISARLPEPVFHPATKAENGHDENITYADLEGKVGGELARQLRDISLKLYAWGAERAARAGVILCDTKFEFGLLDGRLILADEVFTPDSSRFWREADYQPGRAQEAFDKQYVRDWLETTGWDKKPPAPALPDEVVRETAKRYREIFRLLTGRDAPRAD